MRARPARRHVELANRPDREERDEREDAGEAERHGEQQRAQLAVDVVSEEAPHALEDAVTTMLAITIPSITHTI